MAAPLWLMGCLYSGYFTLLKNAWNDATTPFCCSAWGKASASEEPRCFLFHATHLLTGSERIFRRHGQNVSVYLLLNWWEWWSWWISYRLDICTKTTFHFLYSLFWLCKTWLIAKICRIVFLTFLCKVLKPFSAKTYYCCDSRETLDLHSPVSCCLLHMKSTNSGRFQRF